MGRIEAVDHLSKNEGLSNCATTTLASLCEGFSPRERFLELAREDAQNIGDIAVLAAIEWYEKKNTFVYIFCMEPDNNPSTFIRQAYRSTRHQIPEAKFIGAMIQEMLLIPDESGDYEISRHVVGVTSVRKNGKGIIVDTAPKGPSSSGDFFRVVDLGKLDKRLDRLTNAELAVVLIGIPLDHPEFATGEGREYVRQEKNMWNKMVQNWSEDLGVRKTLDDQSF